MLSPDARALREFLARASRRVVWRGIAEGTAAGLFVAALFRMLDMPERANVVQVVATALGLVAAAIAMRLFLSRRVRGSVAALVESRAPVCRNLVVTADELLAHPERANETIIALVCRQAAAVVRTLDLPTLLPLRGSVILMATSLALWVVVMNIGSGAQAALHLRGRNPVANASRPAEIQRVDVVVTPPAYTRRAVETVRDPQRLLVLAGSRIALTVQATATLVNVETIGGVVPMPETHAGTFAASLMADADGFIAIQPASATGMKGARTLIGLSVTPDHAPRVHISAPGRDLFLPNAQRTLTVAVDADDDLGLASLTMRYTKVSGSGERFTFTEGTVPLTLSRTDQRAWKANATWNLESLGLSPGDMVVYRAVAADNRPGAPPVESDSYIAEILAPGGDAAAGFALDTDQERYALSQQMVILKTEKLVARKASLAPDALADESQQIAVEQRRVRAEFVFMMGGEVAEEVAADAGMTDLNEEAEAAGESDIAAGRLANRGRIALVRAIRAMSQASSHLTTVDLADALVSERAALKQLEQAFAHTRILLRALTERERLDLSRRMTGTLADAGRSVVPMPPIAENTRFTAERRVLAQLAGIASQASSRTTLSRDETKAASARTTELAVELLRINTGTAALTPVVQSLQQAASAFARNDRASAARLLDQGATALAALVRGDVPSGPRPLHNGQFDRLNGAWSDAQHTANSGRRTP